MKQARNQAFREVMLVEVNLTYNLEPCYTIILAFLIFGEGLTQIIAG